MKVKIICISLTDAIERRLHMTALLNQIKQELNIEWDFFDAYNGKDIKVDDKKIYYNGNFTGWYHDENIFLIDQIEQFARLHYRKFAGIPYAQNVSVKIDNDNKAWIYMDDDKQFNIDASYFRKKMTMNEIGCALSHLEAMIFYRNNYDAILLLEDDVYLKGNLLSTLDKVNQYNLLNWDIVFLNIPGYGGHPGYIEPNTMVDFNDFNLHVFSHFSSTCSYIVSKNNRILDKPHIDLPLDDYLSRRVDLFMLRVKEPVFMVDYNQLSGISSIPL